MVYAYCQLGTTHRDLLRSRCSRSPAEERQGVRQSQVQSPRRRALSVVAPGTCRPCGATGPRKVAMKTMLTSVFVALALAATLGANVASANVAVQLEIKNQSTNTAGHFVSATTGQKVKFTATLKSQVGKKATAVVTLRADVPTIPGCS